MNKCLIGLVIFKRIVYLVYFVNTLILIINYYNYSNTMNSYTLTLLFGFYSQIVVGILLLLSFAVTTYKNNGHIEDAYIFTYLSVVNLINIIVSIINKPTQLTNKDFNIYYIPFTIHTAVTIITNIVISLCYFLMNDTSIELTDVSSISSRSGTVSENSV